MLTSTGSPLPVEIYRLIYSHLGRHDLTQIMRTCNILFIFTAPHVWREVDFVTLLRLLPESHLREDDAFKRLKIAPPCARLDPYFDRFHCYAPYVEHLDLHSSTMLTGAPWSQSAENWILSYVSDCVLLPHLKTARLLCTAFAISDHPKISFWSQVLVSSSLHELAFCACKQDDIYILGHLLSKCLRLTRLEYHQPQVDHLDPWCAVSDFPALRTLESLDFKCLALDKQTLIWISQIPHLHTLRLCFGSSQEPSDLEGLCTADVLALRFKALRHLTLHFREGGWHEAMCIWRTQIVTNLTYVKVTSLGQLGSKLEQTSQFLSAIAAYSPKLHHLEINEGRTAFEGDSPQHPTALLSQLHTLPLRVLKAQGPISLMPGYILETIGKLWPNLEQLCLEWQVVGLHELFSVSSFLPKLRHLQVRIPSKKPSPNPLSKILEDYIPLAYEHVSTRPTLTIDYSDSTWGNLAYDSNDIDFLARTLVEFSPNVHLGPNATKMRPLFRSRLSYYSRMMRQMLA